MHNLDTLLIKHLPNDFNDEEKEKFLKYFGAKEVKCISSKRKKYNIAFARLDISYQQIMINFTIFS